MKKWIGNLLDKATLRVVWWTIELDRRSNEMDTRRTFNKDVRKIKNTPVSGDALAEWKEELQ